MAHIAGADEARSYQDDNKTKATIAIKHHQSQWSEAQKTQYMANIGLWNYRVTERSKETQACVGSYQTYQATFIGDPVSEELLYMVYIFLDIGEKTTTISHISSDKSIHKNMLRDWVTSTKCKKT